MIKTSLGIKVLASSINEKKDLDYLQNENIDFIAGKIIEKLRN